MQAEVGRDPSIGELWGQQGPGRRPRVSKGGNRTGEVRHRLMRGNPLVRLAMELIKDEQCWPEGRGVVQVDGRSVTR